MELYLIVRYHENNFDILEKTNDSNEAIEARNQYIVELNTPNIAVYCRMDGL